MKKIFFFQAAFLLLGGLASRGQTPADTSKIITLQEVIVKGNIKTDPTLFIVKEDFRDKVTQPKNSGELFADFNGFSLIKRGNYAVDPSFRASQYDQLNVQYDGGVRAFHACPNRMDPITTLVNPEEVTKIEIIKGPFSVRYGPTFGGIINMVTHDGSCCKKKISGSLSSGYESNGKAIVNMVQVSSSLKKWDLSANYSYRNYGNYEDGDGTTIPSSFRTNAYRLKVGYTIDERQRVQVGFRQNFGRDVIHAGLPMDTRFDNSSIANLDYQIIAKGSAFRGLSVKGYYAFVDHEMNNFNRPSFSTAEAVAGVEATTIGGRLESEWDLSAKVKVFGGTDFSLISREGNRNRLVKKNMMGQPLPVPQSFTDKVWQDSHNDQIGLFAESKYLISNTDIISIGARVDMVSSDAKDLDPSFAALYPGFGPQRETNFSGMVSYKKLIGKDQVLELAFGRGLRTASIEERYIAFFNIGQDAYEYIGNPYLKPEANNQWEIGFKGKRSTRGFVEQLGYSISIYYSHYQNYIMGVVDTNLTRKYNPTMDPKNPKRFQNVDKAFKSGFELMGSIRFLRYMDLTAECSYVYTENRETGESLPLTAPLTVRVRLGFEKNKVWARTKATLASSQKRISKAFSENETGGYAVLDLEAGIIPFKSLKLGFGLLNVFDRKYNTHQNFAFNTVAGFGRVPVPEPGRSFTVFVSYSF